MYQCSVCKFIHPVGQLLFYVIICRVIILACSVIIGYFYVCTAGCFELIFHGSLETARAPVLYRLSKTFLSVDPSFVINGCLFRPFHKSGCIFWFRYKCIPKTPQVVYILIYGKLPVSGIYAAEFCMFCLQFFIVIGIIPSLFTLFNSTIIIIVLWISSASAPVHGAVIKSFKSL